MLKHTKYKLSHGYFSIILLMFKFLSGKIKQLFSKRSLLLLATSAWCFKHTLNLNSIIIFILFEIEYRSSRLQLFFRIGALKNFANFTGKNQYRSLFLLRLKKETPIQVHSCEICEYFKNTVFTEHLWWLVLFMKINMSYGYKCDLHNSFSA